MFRTLLSHLVRVGKGSSAYEVSPAIGERDALVILTGVVIRAMRGLPVRFRLARCDGLPLIGKGVRISEAYRIAVGNAFVVEDYAELQGLSTTGLRFGNNVTVGRYARVRPSGYYGRDVGVGLTVGDDSSIGTGAYIGCWGGVTIGDKVMMGPDVTILAENHAFDDASRQMKQQGAVARPTAIDDDVWIGARVVILGGVRVGTGSILAAGSVVTRDVEPYAIVAGVPARVVKRRRAASDLQIQ